MNHQQQIIVAGAGIAGLTAAAYLAKAGHAVTVLEKASYAGGLVNTFLDQGLTGCDCRV